MDTIIRKFPQGNLILLFPREEADLNGNILSYQFIGQHGAASPALITELDSPSMDEAQDLINHYESHFNCELELVEDRSRHHHPTK